MQTTDINGNTELKTALAGFQGSEQYYRHWLRNIVYTEGVKYLADTAGAYWLIDIVASAQSVPQLKGESFQTWILDVYPDHHAKVYATDGNTTTLYSQEIPYTDFPLDSIKLFLADNVLLLPSEY
ncbi:MAG: hypothetical protein HZC28_10815 [Spirochaetes bacterium]|nr:hypothetical protein [Spirochaetota bacterium]